jgi:uridine kinase
MSSKRHWTILVGGGHAAGKKSVCKSLTQSLTDMSRESDLGLTVKTLHLKDHTKPGANGPRAVDFDTVYDLILKTEESNNSVAESDKHTVLIIEGNYALFDERIRDRAIMKVFVHTDPDSRLSQWILRDANDSKELLPGILDEYLTRARPEFNQYISPTRQFADVVMPRGCEETAVKVVATGVYFRLREGLTEESDKQLSSSVTSLLNDSDATKSRFDIRKESFADQTGRFYELS